MSRNSGCGKLLNTLDFQTNYWPPRRVSMRLSIRACTFLLFGLTAYWADADTLPSPEDDVLLVITGALANTNEEREAHFDRSMLESLPSVEFNTNTPWSEGIQNFVGVRLSDLFEFVGATPERIVAHGIDDYKFTITNLDVDHYPIIVAYQHNGNSISVRNLGPLRIMFPFDDYPELISPKNESSAVWQLVKLELF